jgi:hypothetical protein
MRLGVVMCPDRVSVIGYLLKGALWEAEKVLPGHGCELLEMLAIVGDAAFAFGAIFGILIFYAARGFFRWVISSDRYRRYREGRNAN